MTLRAFLLAASSTAMMGVGHTAAFDAATALSRWQTQHTPRIAALAESSKTLQTSMSALCQKKTQPNLDAARAAWQQSYLAWRAVEVLPLGPVLSRRTAWLIDVWPTKTDKVEEAVRLVQRDAAIADNVGAAAQGLPALEYLLWGDDRLNAQLGRLVFKQRCDYALALANDVASEVGELQKEWSSYRATPMAADAVRPAFEEAINLFVAAVDTLRDKKLGRLGGEKANKHPSRQDFDGWRSHSTRAGLLASLATLEATMTDTSAGSSFADQLVAAGNPVLAQKFKDEFAVLHTLINRLPDEISTPLANDPRLAKPLLDSLKRLQGYMEFGVADALGVTIGFKDKEGD